MSTQNVPDIRRKDVCQQDEQYQVPCCVLVICIQNCCQLNIQIIFPCTNKVFVNNKAVNEKTSDVH